MHYSQFLQPVDGAISAKPRSCGPVTGGRVGHRDLKVVTRNIIC